MKDLWISKSIYGDEEKKAVMEVLDSGWLGIGKKSEELERLFSEFIGVKYGMFVNSGSSALLLGLKSLNLPKGTEVVTCAAGFPSTLSPILHLGLNPVVVDAELDTFNIDPQEVKKAITKKTGAIVFAHAAGNLCNMKLLEPLLDKYPSVEDGCDCLGGSYQDKMVGSFGTVSAFSLFASHHITAAGGGGMVMTDSEKIMTDMFSMRDWGKRYVKPGYYQRNFSKYDTDIAGIPYDISYSYDTVGYNMKLIEIGAAFAVEQMRRLAGFIDRRNENFAHLYRLVFKEYGLGKYLIPPRWYEDHKPSWFFFVVTLRNGLKCTRKMFGDYLEEHGVRTRPFFAGNITLQPALRQTGIRRVGNLENSNKLMRDTIMVGVHPGLTSDDMQYIADTFRSFFEKYA